MSDMLYNRRKFINSEKSHYTGAICCVDARNVINQGKTLNRYSFIEISDCHGKVRIHRDTNLPETEFINKIETLIWELSVFKNYLQDEHLETM